MGPRTSPLWEDPPARPFRVAFFGSGDFSVPSLEALAGGRDRVSLVVTPPPRPSGRGRRPSPAPAAAFARKAGLPLLETPKPNDPDAVGFVASLRPDLLVVADYGFFLGAKLLAMGALPPLNVHPSLLPRHRGPAPVNWAIIQGDRELGVTIMLLEKAMDAGPILAQVARPLAPGEGAAALTEELARTGAGALLGCLAGLREGTLRAVPQDHSRATVNRLLRKDDGNLDFALPAGELASRVNGLEPWPGARALLRGRSVQFAGALAAGGAPGGLAPGEVAGLSPDGRLGIATGDGLLLVSSLKMEGKRLLPAAEFAKGHRPLRFDPIA